ncbi:MAG: SPOR domain-containing protein [Nitrosomonadales bacterium]
MNAIGHFIFAFLLVAWHPFACADFEADLSDTGNIQNMSQLRELHARAAAGNAEAQLNMGGVFCKGQEVDQDYAEGAKWFRLAALQGLPQAQFNLGMMYAVGQGVAPNPAEAVKWYRLAAEQGLVLAQTNLGVAYISGQGVRRNEVEAARWIRLAADKGEAQAQFNLAVMYTNGQGVTRNYIEASHWASRAAAQGHDNSRALLLDLTQRIKSEPTAVAEHPTLNAPDVKDNSTGENYYLQLAAFKSSTEAEKYVEQMRVQLSQTGHPLSIFSTDGWVRTQLGPYPNLSEAKNQAVKLKVVLGYEPLLKKH